MKIIVKYISSIPTFNPNVQYHEKYKIYIQEKSRLKKKKLYQ